ncbi:MAG: histidine phosphatase family protein [Actinomycetota bacterium]|nr:histidine phosphatase family protein [Actinomycetota bacterium]
MSNAILVRHGQTAWHREGRYVGTADIPLDDEGKRQAELVASRVAEEEFSYVYSSPYLRCKEMAEKIASLKGYTVTEDKRLREMDLSRWDGKPLDDVIREDGELIKNWMEDPISRSLPGEESLPQVRERATGWLKEVTSTHPGEGILVVSHGAPICVMIADVIGLPLANAFRLIVDVASVSIVNCLGEFSNLKLLNDTNHLRGLE